MKWILIELWCIGPWRVEKLVDRNCWPCDLEGGGDLARFLQIMRVSTNQSNDHREMSIILLWSEIQTIRQKKCRWLYCFSIKNHYRLQTNIIYDVKICSYWNICLVHRITISFLFFWLLLPTSKLLKFFFLIDNHNQTFLVTQINLYLFCMWHWHLKFRQICIYHIPIRLPKFGEIFRKILKGWSHNGCRKIFETKWRSKVSTNTTFLGNEQCLTSLVKFFSYIFRVWIIQFHSID